MTRELHTVCIGSHLKQKDISPVNSDFASVMANTMSTVSKSSHFTGINYMPFEYESRQDQLRQ